MTTVSSATAAATASAGSAAASIAGGTVDQAQDRFLTLLVSQLKNQDPLNPLDNAQITSQLAQLSTVTGINKLNDTMAAMSASADARQYLQAAGLVGHDVVVDGNALALNGGEGQGAFDLAADAEHVTVSIADATGRTVRTIDLGAQTAGLTGFHWDGRDDTGAVQNDGKYTISVTATSSGNAITATPHAVARVAGVVPGANGGQLQLDNLGKVDLSAIQLIN